MIYDAHVQVASYPVPRFFWRPALQQTFDPDRYRAEIKALFPEL
jgi:hypothetical protein